MVLLGKNLYLLIEFYVEVWLSWPRQPQDGDISNHLTYLALYHIYIFPYTLCLHL